MIKREQDPPSPARFGSEGAYSPEMHREMVAIAAYYRAERRGFREGGEFDDWLDAEAEIGRLLNSPTGPAPEASAKPAPGESAKPVPRPGTQSSKR